MIAPVAYGRSPRSSAATTRPTSSGCPQRPLGDEAVGDAAIVDLAHARGHVGRDDAGPHLVHRHPVLGEPRREQPRRHRQSRLADAVLAAVGRGHLRRHRRDEDDGRGERRVGAAAFDLIAGDRLGEEVRSLQVACRSNSSKLSSRGLEQIGADGGRAPGVVDERVEPARIARARRRRAARGRRTARDRRARSATVAADCRRSSSAPRTRPPAAMPPSTRSQPPAPARGDAEPDAARAAGDECGRRLSS